MSRLPCCNGLRAKKFHAVTVQLFRFAWNLVVCGQYDQTKWHVQRWLPGGLRAIKGIKFRQYDRLNPNPKIIRALGIDFMSACP